MNIFNALDHFLDTTMTGLFNGLDRFLNAFSHFLDTTMTGLFNGLDRFLNAFSHFLDTTMTGLFNGLDRFFNALDHFLDATMTGLFNGLDRFFNALDHFLDATMTTLSNGPDRLFNFFSTMPSRIKNKICSYWPFVNLLSQSEKNNHLWNAACNDNNTHKLQTLINAGANVNFTHNNITTLMRAVMNGQTKNVTILIKKGALPTVKALHCAFIKNYSEIMQCLLKALSPEIIEAEFNHENTTPELKQFIKEHQIKNLKNELFDISSKNKTFSPFNSLPPEVLALIFSKNYRIFKPEEITKTIKSTCFSEATPGPVIFSAVQSASSENIATIDESPDREKTSILNMHIN